MDDPEPRRRLNRRPRSRAEFEATVADLEAQVRAANAKLEERAGRNLPLATFIGLLLGFCLLFSLIVIKDLFILFAAGLLVFTAFELASALRSAARDVPLVPSVIGALAVPPAAFYWGASGQWLVTLGVMLLVIGWRLAETAFARHRGSRRDLVGDVMAGVFIQAYVVFLGSFAALLTGREGGQWWTLGFLIVVIATDTGAYATGLVFGAHALAPRISPKKTWEGFLGSLTTAAVTGVLVGIYMLQLPWWAGFVFGLSIALTATVGDLTESLIKRDLGIKDMSTWLPGHGGFLDRLDSILPSAAVAYGLFLVFA